MSRITWQRDDSSGCFRLHFKGEFSSILRSMHDNAEGLSDIDLTGVPPAGGPCDLQPIRAHKNILAKASDHMFELFTVNGKVDWSTITYTFTDIDHVSLCSVIQLIYTGTVNVHEVGAAERVRGIFVAAEHLKMKELAEACEKFLASNDRIDGQNCLDMFQFAFKHNCTVLLGAVCGFIAKDLSTISKSPKFLNLTQDEVAKFLLSEPVVAANADDRCQAAIAWLSHESPSRAASAECIMSMVDLKAAGVMPGTLLLAAQSAVIRPTIKGFALNLIDAMASIIQRMSPMESEKEKEQKPEDARGEAWYIVGSKNDKKNFYRYDVAGRQWSVLPELPWKRHSAGVCAIGKRLIVMGGYKNNRCVASIDEYNTVAQTWSTSKAELSGARERFAVTADSKYAYVFGGRDSDLELLDVVERYCAEVGVIERLPSMERKKYYASAACKEDNVVFVVGEYLQEDADEVWYNNNTVVVKYDHANKKQDAIVMSKPYFCSPGVAFLGDDLYVAGGSSNKQVEILNTETGKIRFCAAEMGNARAGCSAVPLNHNVLCVLGGRSPHWGESRSVEKYDAREGKWAVGVIPDMPEGCANFGFAHVRA